ncbi:GlsB/YeaQ/YmgE family stress response membrane protein [Lysobacter sp. GCM10012299]|uniref:GlsB/YeaQ/YmgE family stress response membrane protein n=1 Tax=Lysobacter sp. GCM10012299 TaxID=3317333 RepID=UPI003607396C
MGILVWLIVGGIIGWVASLIMKTDAQQGLFLNIIVGIIGAFIGGWLGGLVGLGGDINSGNFSMSGLLMSLVGAIVLLAIVNLFRRGRVR